MFYSIIIIFWSIFVFVFFCAVLFEYELAIKLKKQEKIREQDYDVAYWIACAKDSYYNSPESSDPRYLAGSMIYKVMQLLSSYDKDGSVEFRCFLNENFNALPVNRKEAYALFVKLDKEYALYLKCRQPIINTRIL